MSCRDGLSPTEAHFILNTSGVNLILLMLALLPCLSLFANPFPVEIKQNLILCEATIDGKTVILLLDSGAPGLVLNSKYFSQNQDEAYLCQGINGSFHCPTRKVQYWEWLGIHFKKSNALLTDLSFLEKALNQKIDGLAGLSLLSDYYVSLNLDHQSISVSKHDDDISSFSKFQYVDHVPVITCKVNGQTTLLGMDTGAETNFLFSTASLPENTTSANTVVVIGTDNTPHVKHRQYMNLAVASHDEMHYAEFIVDMNGEGYFHHPILDGLLGQSFLSQFNITIHPGKQKIRFSPRQAVETPLLITASGAN